VVIAGGAVVAVRTTGDNRHCRNRSPLLSVLVRPPEQVKFTPPAVRYGALFNGSRDDWFGLRALLSPPEGSARTA